MLPFYLRLGLTVGAMLFGIIAFEQPTFIKISGQVTCHTDSICTATVQAKWLRQKLLAGFSNTNNKGEFSLTLPWLAPDTLLVIANHIGYKPDSQRLLLLLPIAQKIGLQLRQVTDTLTNVTVTAPATWRRGDTTFYKASSYLAGYEQKLIELVKNIPQFSFDESGNLLYKRKRISKILIGGEAIFADRLQMLLDNIPLHIIKNLQILENQHAESLNKGLPGGNQVFINLELKDKVKWMPVFGDVEGGIGTKGRYGAKAILFSVAGKTKIGYNATVGNMDKSEWFNPIAGDASQAFSSGKGRMMDTDPIRNISILEKFQYLNNRLVNSELQLTNTIKKNIKSTTTLLFKQDWQQQQEFSQQNLLQIDSFFTRIQNTKNTFRPQFLIVKQHFEIPTSASSKWEVKAEAVMDKAHSYKIVAIDQNNTSNISDSRLKQGFLSLLFETSFIKRKSNNASFQWKQFLLQQSLPQINRGHSNDWEAIFATGMNRFDWLQQNYTTQITTYQTQMNWLNKKGKKLSPISLIAQWERVTLSTSTYLSNQQPPTLTYWLYDTAEIYQKGNLMSSISLQNSLFKTFIAKVQPSFGYGFVQTKQQKSSNTVAQPMYKVTVNIVPKDKNKDFGLDINATGKLPETNYLPSVSIPNSLFTNHTYRRYNKILHTLDATLIHTTTIRSPNIFLGNYVIYNYAFQSSASLHQFQSILETAIDSLTNKPNSSTSAGTHLKIYLGKKLKSFIEFNGSFTRANFWITTSASISPVYINNYSIVAKWKIEETLQFFFEGSTNYHVSSYQSQLKNSLAQQPVKSLQLHAKPGLIVKPFVFLQETFLHIDDISGANENIFLFLTFSARYKMPKKPLFIIAKFDNLSNTTNYTQFSNYANYRSFTNLPIRPLSATLSFNYQL